MRLALPHLQFEQFPLQEHLMSWLHALDTSGIVVHTGVHEVDSLVQPKHCEEGGTTDCACVHVVCIPA